MTAKRSGLGRNLSALLSQTDNRWLNGDKSEDAMLSLGIHSLQPGAHQPRGEMDEVALTELSESIRKQGVLQPLIVRETDGQHYEIIAGERRWRAAQIAGLTQIPVIVKQVSDEVAMAIGLVENVQREDLNALDQARAMQRLFKEFSLTHQQIADLVCKSRTAVSNYLRLLNLNDWVKTLLENGDIEMGHARSLLILTCEEQTDVAKQVVAKNLSVRETERLVARIKSGIHGQSPKEQPLDLRPKYQRQLDRLSSRLQTSVDLKQAKSGKGTVVIHYQDETGLQQVIEALTS